MNEIIPVQIIQAKKKRLTIKIFDPSADCLQCQKGLGCGKRFWFRFLGQSVLEINHHRAEEFQAEQYAELIIPHSFFYLISGTIYGLPLLFFLMTLLFSQRLPEYLQFILSFMALLIGAYLGGLINRLFLFRQIEIRIVDDRPAEAIKIC